MAVHSNLPGIEVTVCVDDEPLKEYEAENDEIKHDDLAVARHQQACTVTKYIGCTTGKSFVVKVAIKEPYEINCPKLRLQVKVDGMTVRSLYSRRRGESKIYGFLEQTLNSTTIRPMKFADIDDDFEKDNSDDTAYDSSNIGEISVRIDRRSEGIIAVETVSRNPINRAFSKKSLVKNPRTHGTSFESPIPYAAPKLWKTEYLDGQDFPQAIFKLKYRSLEALKQLGHVPRPPSPEPKPLILDIDNELDSITLEEKAKVREFLRKIRGKDNTANGCDTKSKLKGSDGTMPGSKINLKRELKNDVGYIKSYKRHKKMHKKMIIDLTGDED